MGKIVFYTLMERFPLEAHSLVVIFNFLPHNKYLIHPHIIYRETIHYSQQSKGQD